MMGAEVVHFVSAGAMLVCALLCCLIASGCGRAQPRRSPSSSTLGDTVRVTTAQGTTIIVPAPQGMADVMSVAGRAPITSRHGDVVWGMFQPRERLQEALRRDYHSNVEVMLLLNPEGPGSVP